MEGKDMAGLEGGAKRGIFRIIPTRERIPVVPKPTTEPALTPEQGKSPSPQKKTWSKRVKFALAGTALAAVLGAGAYQIPQVQENFIGIVRMLSDNEVPSTFDSNAETIVFGDNNIKRITPEEAEKQDLLTAKFDEERKILAMLSPFILPQGTTGTLDKSTYEVRTIKRNEPRFTVPSGTEIVLPKGMHYRLVGGNPALRQDPNLVYGLTAVQYDKETGRSVLLNFYLFDETKGEEIPISTILPITLYKDLYPNGVIIWDSVTVDYWMRLPASDGTTPIATTISNQLIHVIPSGVSGDKLNENQIKDMQIQLQQQDGKLLLVTPTPSTP